MEEELVKYRKATLKQKFLIGKKFCRFYLNDFRPITKVEKTDRDRSRYFYRGFLIGGAVTMGFISLKLRRMKISSLGVEGTPRDQEMVINMLNDAIMAFIGAVVGQVISCDYIYKHRLYVLERIYYERDHNI